jgi:hypothetical protein
LFDEKQKAEKKENGHKTEGELKLTMMCQFDKRQEKHYIDQEFISFPSSVSKL